MKFLGDVASGAFDVEPVHAVDWLRIADLVGRYRDLPLGTVDASVIACAERLGVDEIATVDRGPGVAANEAGAASHSRTQPGLGCSRRHPRGNAMNQEPVTAR